MIRIIPEKTHSKPIKMNSNTNANTNLDNFDTSNSGKISGEIRRPSVRRPSALRRLSKQVELLFVQALGLESLADLSSSSIRTEDMDNGIEDSLNLVKCKKMTGDGPVDEKDCHGEPELEGDLSCKKTEVKPMKNIVRRRGVRRGTVDSCNGEESHSTDSQTEDEETKKQRCG